MTLALILIWLAVSMIIAFFGRKRKFGFWGYFILSLVFSPLIGFIVLLGSDPKKS